MQLTQLNRVSDFRSEVAPSNVFRPFFLAGILTVLTAGCTLGAIALLGIGISGTFTSSKWAPTIWAHANSQFFGWVGFFVLGFALQHQPPARNRAGAFQTYAAWIIGLMASGILFRFLAEAQFRLDRELWIPVGLVSTFLQFIAVVLYFVCTRTTGAKGVRPTSWHPAFGSTALGILLVCATLEPVMFLGSHHPDPASSLAFLANWFAPYRELQFLGFAAMMIFGVALVKLHSCFGYRAPHAGLANLGFGLWTAGLAARILGHVQFAQQEFVSGSAPLIPISSWLLFGGAAATVAAIRVFEPTEMDLRVHKFLRAALGWLLVAGLLLVLEPLHLAATGQAFSHAYTGAIRHAVTVGFISQMIVGFSLRVVAANFQLDNARLSQLWSAFVLLNLGNSLRVGLEIATDYTGRAFLPMGFTGLLELAALGLWAGQVALPILQSRKRGRTEYRHAKVQV